MANWDNLLKTENYITLLESRINDRDVDVLKMLDGVVVTGALPVGAKRWNASNKNWEVWGGTVWGGLADKYNINVDTVDGFHAGNAAGQLLVLDGSAAVPLAQIPAVLTGKIADDSNKLGGALPSTGPVATTIAERDGLGGLSAAGFTDSRPTVSGFVRVSGGICALHSSSAISFASLVTGWNTIAVPATAKEVLIRLRMAVVSIGSIGLRQVRINSYYSAAFNEPGDEAEIEVYEPSGYGAGSLLHLVNVLILAPTDGAGSTYLYANSSGGLYPSQYAIVGYWD